MMLLTKEIKRKLPALGSTDNIPVADKTVAVKFFTPWTSWTWYAFEGEEQEDGDWLFFGLVEGMETELGYFALSELQSVRGPWGLTIERDMHYSQVLWERDARRLGYVETRKSA